MLGALGKGTWTANPLPTKGMRTCAHAGDQTLRDTAEAEESKTSMYLDYEGIKVQYSSVQGPSSEIPD